jgi:hypothetical protein
MQRAKMTLVTGSQSFCDAKVTFFTPQPAGLMGSARMNYIV